MNTELPAVEGRETSVEGGESAALTGDWKENLRAIHLKSIADRLASEKRWRALSASALVRKEEDVAAFALSMASVNQDLAREELRMLRAFDASPN